MRQLTLVGVAHRTAPLTILERFPRADRLGPALAVAAAAVRADGAVAVSTCNRFELYLYGSRPVSRGDAARLLGALSGQPPRELASRVELRTGDDAVLHLFTVAAGLDSRVVGEGEILGQVRAAARTARTAGTLHPELDSIFQRAVAAGRRARRESGLGQSASVGNRAADAVDRLLDGAAGRRVVVIGAGPIAQSALQRLDRIGARTTVCTRRPDLPRPEMGTRRLLGLDRLPEILTEADAVVCAAAAPGLLLTEAMLRDVADRRGDTGLLVLDLAVPRTAARGDFAQVLDLDSLPQPVRSRPVHDQAVADAAAASVRQQAETYRQWLASRQAAALITDIRLAATEPLPTVGGGRLMTGQGRSRVLIVPSRQAAHRLISQVRRYAADGDLDAAGALASSFMSDGHRSELELVREEECA